MPYFLILFIVAIIGFIWFKFVKYALFVVDYLLIVVLSVTYFHRYVSSKITHGLGSYIWDILLIIVVIALYTYLLLSITDRLPKLSNCLHYVIAVFGVAFSIRFIIFSLTAIGLIPSDSVYDMSYIYLIGNDKINLILHYIIFILLAIPVSKARIKAIKNFGAPISTRYNSSK